MIEKQQVLDIIDVYRKNTEGCLDWANRLFEHKIIELFDGYEIQNGAIIWSEERIKYMKSIIPNAKQYRNYDAHEVDGFGDSNTNTIKKAYPLNKI